MNILVLAGGDSAERAVSLESGGSVADALHGLGHDVDLVDPCETPIAGLQADRWKIAVPMVHGTGGEDGTLQQALDDAGIRYVGSSVAASKLTFDKVDTNSRLRMHGIAGPDSVVVTSSQSSTEHAGIVGTLNAIGEGLDGVVTKPPQQGSSIGIAIVRQQKDLHAALELAFQYGDRCLVERFIAGREVTVPVIDGHAYPALEILPAVTWYDYDAKYADDRTQYVVASDSHALGQVALDACETCGVTGIARVDFRVDSAGRPWVLEINTVPGMTSHSLVPKSAASLGLSLGEVCESAIRTRLTR